MPAWGIKLDACPGRINTVHFTTKAVGRYYGQCSELCGINHSFMPIMADVENVNFKCKFDPLGDQYAPTNLWVQ